MTIGIGAYAPYGLETKWPVAGFAGRFMGYNTKIHSIYIQPTAGYQVNNWLKVGLGWAYITSKLELHQRVDLSTQQAEPDSPEFDQCVRPRGYCGEKDSCR